MRRLVAFLCSVAVPAWAGESLYFAEGNRLHVLDLVTGGARVLVENAAADPARGRDLNGMVCRLADGSGRMVLGEDTGQPHPPAGWGVLERDGRQVGKLTPRYAADSPDPYGCAIDTQGRLFTTDVGDPGFLRATGQLLLWFDPGASEGACLLAGGLATPSGIAIDGQGRIYVAQAGRLSIVRYLPPFPTSPRGCGGRARIRFDARGDPLPPEVLADGLAFPDGVAVLREEPE